MAGSTDEETSWPLRVVRAPRVYVLARPSIDWGNISAFLNDEEAFSPTDKMTWKRTEDAQPGEHLVEFAGRVCYLSFGKNQGRATTEAYLANILNMRHGSVLEHAVWSVLIADVSRSLSHELVRHRQFSFSQQSSRYVGAKREAVIPPSLSDSMPETIEAWKRATAMTFASQELQTTLYEVEAITEGITSEERRRSRKRAREVGRAMMPHSAVTRLVMTGNARAWRWLLEVRGSLDVDPEMRRLMLALARVLKQESPLLFGDVDIVEVEGEEVITVLHPKV